MAGNTFTNFGGTINAVCNGLFTQNENDMIVANNTFTSVVDSGYCSVIEFQSTNEASLNMYRNTVSVQYME